MKNNLLNGAKIRYAYITFETIQSKEFALKTFN